MTLIDFRKEQYCSRDSMGNGLAITLIDGNYHCVKSGEISNKLTEEQIVYYKNAKDLYLSDKYGVKLKDQTIKKETNQKRNIAFYKKSGTDWTEEEFNNIADYCCSKTINISNDASTRKYISDDSYNGTFMYPWNAQEDERNFKNCKQVAYEDIFPQEQTFPEEQEEITFDVPNPFGSFASLANTTGESLFTVSGGPSPFEAEISSLKSQTDVKLEEALSRISALEEQLSNQKETIMANQEKSIIEQLQDELCSGKTPKVKKEKTPKIVCNVKGEFMTFKNEDALKTFMWTSREQSVIRYDLAGTVTVPFELETKAPKTKA